MSADCLKLTSYFGERQRSGAAFTADALLELYGRHAIAASVLLRGTEGFGLKHHLRTDRSLTLSEDLPLIAVAVDTRPRIESVLGTAALSGSPPATCAATAYRYSASLNAAAIWSRLAPSASRTCSSSRALSGSRKPAPIRPWLSRSRSEPGKP